MGIALGCWQEVLEWAPRWPRAYCMVAALAREIGNLPLCEEVVEKGLQLFPHTDAMVVEAAELARRRGQWERSVELWGRIVDRPHADPQWLKCHAHDLMVLGQFDLLDVLLPSYRTRFPRHRGLLGVQGMVASARGDHDRALAIWTDYRKLYPNDAVGWDHYGRAYQARELDRLGEREGRRPAEEAAPARIEVVADEGARQLLLGFESIGSNCEFGLTQRRFGAEPLGLLRFNHVPYGSLVSAAMRRFEGMGDPENTKLGTLNDEFFVEDRRWHLAMHTWVFREQVNEAQFYEKMCRRVVYLRQKLLEDFAEARKVFVFLDSKVSIEDIKTLHAILRTMGNAVLLHVRSLAAEQGGFPAGERGKVEEIAPDLFVGFLSREGVLPNGIWDILFDEWTGICRKVRSHIDARVGCVPQQVAVVGR
jgi:tetratricopeptide (TPR) repeat protein